MNAHLPCLMLVGCALWAAAAPNVVEPPELKVYGLRFADGSNTAEAVKTVAGEDAKVIFDAATRNLMVLAPGSRQATVAELIRQLDIAPRNVRIDVRFNRRSSGQQRGASVSGGGTVVLDGRGGHSTIRLRPQVEDTRVEANTSTLQQLLVASGRQASLFIGEEVPYIDWIVEYGRRYQYLEQQVAWQRVGAYLAIEPTVIGDGPLIRVRLTPELSGLVDGHPLRTRFANVATDVTVSDGVPFPLGGLAQKNEFFSRFLVGVNRSGQRETLDIELTAHIVPPTGPTR